MKSTTLMAVILCCGAGTFLIRWLPLWLQDRAVGAAPSASGRLRRALDAIGPSAIAALLTVSLWSLIDLATPTARALPVLCGLLGVVAGRRLSRSIAWSTLAGVLAYGVALWMLRAIL